MSQSQTSWKYGSSRRYYRTIDASSSSTFHPVLAAFQPVNEMFRIQWKDNYVSLAVAGLSIGLRLLYLSAENLHTVQQYLQIGPGSDLE